MDCTFVLDNIIVRDALDFAKEDYNKLTVKWIKALSSIKQKEDICR